MLRHLFLLLLSWHSLNSYADDVVLYAPTHLTNNPLAIELTFAFENYARVVTNIDDANSGTIIVGAGKDFLESIYVNNDTYCIAILPYAFGAQPSENIYHQYFHVSPRAVARYLSQQFKSIKVGYLYFDEDDPFLNYTTRNSYKNVEFVGRKTTNDVYSAVRRLRETDKVDIFLVTNDTRIYTSKVLRFLLEDLYRQNMPAVSLSKQLLSAGVSFALIPDVQEFTTQTVATARHLQQNVPVPHIQFAESFNVVVNERLVKRFGITLSEVNEHDE